MESSQLLKKQASRLPECLLEWISKYITWRKIGKVQGATYIPCVITYPKACTVMNIVFINAFNCSESVKKHGIITLKLGLNTPPPRKERREEGGRNPQRARTQFMYVWDSEFGPQHHFTPRILLILAPLGLSTVHWLGMWDPASSHCIYARQVLFHWATFSAQDCRYEFDKVVQFVSIFSKPYHKVWNHFM